MKTLSYSETWPESWKYSYSYDCLEVYNHGDSSGYVRAYQQRVKHTINFIKTVAKPSAKILDIAAAQGNFSLRLAELGYKVTWNDLREDLIDYVKLKYETGDIHYLPGNIFSLNANQQFDVVLLAEVIEHVAHPDQLLKKIAEFVKPGGHIVITTPNGEYFRNRLPRFSDCPNPEAFESIQFKPNSDGHIFLLHLDEIHKITQALNLKIEKISFFANPLTNGHIKLWLLLKLIPYGLVNWFEKLSQQLPLKIKKRIFVGTAVLIKC